MDSRGIFKLWDFLFPPFAFILETSGILETIYGYDHGAEKLPPIPTFEPVGDRKIKFNQTKTYVFNQRHSLLFG